MFYFVKPVGPSGSADKNLLESSAASPYGFTLKDASQVDWYQTVMQTPDVKSNLALTFQHIVDDWKCDNATQTHPDDASIPCDPACDLRHLLTINYTLQTAMLTNTEARGPDGTRDTAPWKILQACNLEKSVLYCIYCMKSPHIDFQLFFDRTVSLSRILPHEANLKSVVIIKSRLKLKTTFSPSIGKTLRIRSMGSEPAWLGSG